MRSADDERWLRLGIEISVLSCFSHQKRCIILIIESMHTDMHNIFILFFSPPCFLMLSFDEDGFDHLRYRHHRPLSGILIVGFLSSSLFLSLPLPSFSSSSSPSLTLPLPRWESLIKLKSWWIECSKLRSLCWWVMISEVLFSGRYFDKHSQQ